MEHIFLVYGLAKETVTAQIKLYKNIKAMVHSQEGDTGFLETCL